MYSKKIEEFRDICIYFKTLFMKTLTSNVLMKDATNNVLVFARFEMFFVQ